jgi:hypothetical protein
MLGSMLYINNKNIEKSLKRKEQDTGKNDVMRARFNSIKSPNADDDRE